MLRKLLWAAPLILFAAGASVPASATGQGAGQNCEQQQESSTSGRSIRRGILGGLARGALGRFGGSAGSLATAYLPVGELLDEVSSELDAPPDSLFLTGGMSGASFSRSFNHLASATVTTASRRVLSETSWSTS